MRFNNRTQAGALLADALSPHITRDTVVYAMPRGGAVVAAPIARRYKIPLEFAITRKIGHPHEPEFAIGAVSENGHSLYSSSSMQGVTQSWLREETRRQHKEALRRRKEYTGDELIISAKDKVALIVDDGAATGISLKLAVQMLFSQHPKKILIALPVAPRSVVSELQEDANEVIVLWSPEIFAGSVGAYYDEFEQVSDREVAKIYVELHTPTKDIPLVSPLKKRKRLSRVRKSLPFHE